MITVPDSNERTVCHCPRGMFNATTGPPGDNSIASVPHLLTDIREAQTERSLKRLQERFLRYDLVICDEFGYVSLDKEGGEQLFNHLSLRAGKKATITTTNLPFIRWDEIIKDKALCSALVDRLCHKAYLVNMSGPSYRVLETKKKNEK